jgi:hypothetical protein
MNSLWKAVAVAALGCLINLMSGCAMWATDNDLGKVYEFYFNDAT